MLLQHGLVSGSTLYISWGPALKIYSLWCVWKKIVELWMAEPISFVYAKFCMVLFKLPLKEN